MWLRFYTWWHTYQVTVVYSVMCGLAFVALALSTTFYLLRPDYHTGLTKPTSLTLNDPNTQLSVPDPPKNTALATGYNFSRFTWSRPPPYNTELIPKNFSYTDNAFNYILTPIRDQGYCGSCFAFSVLSALADRIYLVTAGQFNKPLSVQDLICNYTTPVLSCEKGGYVDKVLDYLERHGVVLEKEYPYNASTQETGPVTCDNTQKQTAANGTGSYVAYQRDTAFIGDVDTQRAYTAADFTHEHKATIDQIRQEIYLAGPVVAIIRFETWTIPYRGMTNPLLLAMHYNWIYKVGEGWEGQPAVRTEGLHAI